MKTTARLWIGIGVLAFLSPLGILLPHLFKSGDAWGEWDMFPGIWSAPLPGYAPKGWEGKGLIHLSLGYIFSAVLGVAAAVLAATLIGRLLVKKGEE